MLLRGVSSLVNEIGWENFRKQEDRRLSKAEKFLEYPGFQSLKTDFIEKGYYKRLPDSEIAEVIGHELETMPINIGLDIGSTMAKILIADAIDGRIIFKGSYDNHGDTIETVKQIFLDIKKKGVKSLNIQNI